MTDAIGYSIEQLTLSSAARAGEECPTRKHRHHLHFYDGTVSTPELPYECMNPPNRGIFYWGNCSTSYSSLYGAQIHELLIRRKMQLARVILMALFKRATRGLRAAIDSRGLSDFSVWRHYRNIQMEAKNVSTIVFLKIDTGA